MLGQSGLESQANARSSTLAAAQSVIAPQGGGSVSDAMNSFFTSLQTLTANPSDPSARSAVLAQATQLATTFSTTSSALAQQQSAIFTQAQGVTTQVNADLSQIAQLNQQIVQDKAAGGDTASLTDQRNTLVTDVANQMGATQVTDPSGSITFFAAGAVLVSGNSASTMTVSQDSTGALKVTLAQKNGSPTDITAGVTDGTLGGIREARDVTIAQASSQLDQIAYNAETAVNTVHESGYGLDGVTGRPLFTPPTQVAGAAAAMSVDPLVDGQPDKPSPPRSSAADVPGGNDVAVQLEALANQALGRVWHARGAVRSDRFGQLGAAKSSADTDSATRADMVTQAENLNSSASGVSLNEEMVNLTKFQQAFLADTRVLQVTDQLLGDFMTTMASA